MTRAPLAVVGSGVLAGAIAAVLALLAVTGTAAIGAGLFAVQVVIALAWLAAIGARGSLGAFAIAVAAAAAVDITLGLTDGPDIGQAAPIVGIAFVLSLLHQLARKPRRAVTMSLAGTLSAVGFGVCAAAYLALLGEPAGDRGAAVALLGVGAALAVARAIDLVLARPAVFRGSRRGLIGVVIGAGAAVAVGAGYGGDPALTTGVAIRIAVIAAMLALLADIAVDAVLTQAPPPDERRLSALTPLGVLLPVVMAGPVAYVTGRILLG